MRCVNAGVFRYEPQAQKFEVYVSYGFANPHGHAFDRWGQDIVIDGTGAVPTTARCSPAISTFPHKHARPPQVYQQRTRPRPGIEILSSRHFPEEFQGNLLVANVIGFQGILRYKIEDKGASLAGTELEPILSSTRPELPAVRHRRSGPTGPSTSSTGRTRSSATCSTTCATPAATGSTAGSTGSPTKAGRSRRRPRSPASSIDELLDLLKEPEDRVRYRARIELGARDTAEVIAAAQELGRRARQDRSRL